jgi:hypothetical protein
MVRLQWFRNLHDGGGGSFRLTHATCGVQVSAVARKGSEPGLKD